MTEMDRDAIEIVGPERARLARFLPLGSEHEVIDDQLRAPVEEIGERESARRPLKLVPLFHPLPGHRHSAARQRVTLACEFLLGGDQFEARLQQFLVRNDSIFHGQSPVFQAGTRRSYSCRSRLQPSQNGPGSLPVARATRMSRCICQPALTLSRVARSGTRRWVTVSSTSLPSRCSTKETPPVFPQVMASLWGGSSSVIRLCIRCSSEKPGGRRPGGSVSSSLRQTSSTGAPTFISM